MSKTKVLWVERGSVNPTDIPGLVLVNLGLFHAILLPEGTRCPFDEKLVIKSQEARGSNMEIISRLREGII